MSANATAAPNPLVSVVVPVYDIESYVADAVRSVIGQTMGDWELICVDDGSHDGSLGICRDLAAGDERILVQDGAWHDERGLVRSREYPGVWNGAEIYMAQLEAGGLRRGTDAVPKLPRILSPHSRKRFMLIAE